MPKKTDYLYATARVRALEASLLNEDRMERMLAAKTNDEAVKVLSECGYGGVPISTPSDIEKAIASERAKVYELLDKISADKNLVDVMKIKYDYHNIKVIIKTKEKEENSHLFIDAGRVKPFKLEEFIRESKYADLNDIMSAAIIEAKDVLSRTNDPQLSDFILDKACLAEMKNAAKETKSAFLIGYIKFLIDMTNLRAFIRCSRMGKNSDFLKYAVIEGGGIDTKNLLFAVNDANFKAESIYSGTDLENAATVGESCLHGEKTLTMFEKICDDALMTYLRKAKYISFGEEPVFAYLAAKEAEFTAVRTILAGRLSRLSPEMIRERLRITYV